MGRIWLDEGVEECVQNFGLGTLVETYEKEEEWM
jgi:hypothetical protein